MRKLGNLRLHDNASTPQVVKSELKGTQHVFGATTRPHLKRETAEKVSPRGGKDVSSPDVNHSRENSPILPGHSDHLSNAADETMELSDSHSDDTNVFGEAPVFLRRFKVPKKTHGKTGNHPQPPETAPDTDLAQSSTILTTRKRRFHTPDLATPSHMSICSTSNSLATSISDSTPCPPHCRKRLKFKDEGTPSGRPKLLNLLQIRILADTDAYKTSGPNNSQVNEHANDSHDSHDLNDPETPAEIHLEHMLQTPISQSTPTSSRQPSPPTVNFNEFGAPVNGYSFVGVEPKHNHVSYETPTQTSSQSLKNHYIQNNYSIVGEMPILAAGLMDESDTHVADKRIGDPYLEMKDNSLREWYFEPGKVRYPLLSNFHNGELTAQQSLEECLQTSLVREFYSSILETDELMLSLLKKERLKWHPDKWLNISEDQLQIVTALSLTLNIMIQELADQQYR